MIQGPERMNVPTVAGERVTMDVNWSPGLDGKYVRLNVGGKEAVIPRESLIRLSMFLASPDEQEKMLPTRQVTIRHYTKDVFVRMNQDMKRGEILKVPVRFDIPLSEGGEGLLLSSSSYFN